MNAVTTSSSQSPIDIVTPDLIDTDLLLIGQRANASLNLGASTWGYGKAPTSTRQAVYDAITDYSWEINAGDVGVTLPAQSILFKSAFASGTVSPTITRFNLHSPSEHTVDGQSYEVEMNLEYGSNLSMRIFFDSTKGGSAQSEFIGTVFDAFRTRDYLPENERLDINFESLRESVDFSSFYNYNGSSTRFVSSGTGSGSASGCAGGMEYIIIKDVQNISTEQLATIRAIMPSNSAGAGGVGNNRAIQPLAQAGVPASSIRKVYYKPPQNYINTQETRDASSALFASAGALALAAVLAY